MRGHACLTTGRGGIAIPGGGTVDLAPFRRRDPTLYLGVVGFSEPLDETRGNLPSPASCAANVRPAVLTNVHDTFFEDSLSRDLVAELGIHEDFHIGQHTVDGLDEYVLGIVLAGRGMARRPGRA